MRVRAFALRVYGCASAYTEPTLYTYFCNTMPLRILRPCPTLACAHPVRTRARAREGTPPELNDAW